MPWSFSFLALTLDFADGVGGFGVFCAFLVSPFFAGRDADEDDEEDEDDDEEDEDGAPAPAAALPCGPLPEPVPGPFLGGIYYSPI